MRRKSWKNISALLLTVMLLFQVVPAQAFAAYADSGTLGISTVQEETPKSTENPDNSALEGGTTSPEEGEDSSEEDNNSSEEGNSSSEEDEASSEGDVDKGTDLIPNIDDIEGLPIPAGQGSGYHLELKWLSDDPDDATDWTYKTLDNAKYALTYQLTINIEDSEGYAAGDMEIQIPASLWRNRSNTAVLPTEYGVPKSPNTSTGNVPFHYQIKKIGGTEYVTFQNYAELMSGDNYKIEVTYSFYPNQMWDNSQATLQAEGNADGQQATSNPINFTLETGVEITSVRKSFSDYNSGLMYTWNNAFGPKPADFSDYKWVSYYLTITGLASQRYTLEYVDDPSHGGVVYDFFGYNQSKITYDSDTNTATTPISTGNPGAYGSDIFYVLVKYPKNLPDGAELENKITVKLIGDSGDPDDWSEMSTAFRHKWEDYKFTYNGPLVTIGKYATQAGGKLTTIQGSLLRLRYGLEADLSPWDTHTIVHGYDLDSGYTVEFTDDYHQWQIGGSDGSYVRMTGDDYAITEAYFLVDTYQLDKSTGEEIYPGEEGYNNPTYQIEALVAGDSSYKVVESGTLTSNASGRLSGGGELPQDTIHVRITLRDCKGYTDLRVMVTDVLKSSDATRQWLKDNETGTQFDIQNFATTRVYDKAGLLLNPVTEFSYAPSLSHLKDWDIATYNQYMQRDFATMQLTGGTNKSSFSKSVLSPSNDSVNSRVLVQYSLDGYESYGSITPAVRAVLTQEGWTPADRRELIFYDLLPLGTFYDEGFAPEVTRPNGSTIPLDCSVQVDITNNYKGSGRQMVTFRVTLADGEDDWQAPSSTKDIQAGARIKFQAFVPWENLQYATNVNNLSAYQTSRAGEELLGIGSIDNGGTGNFPFAAGLDKDGNPLMADLRGDGYSDGVRDTLFAYAKQNINVPTSMAEGLTKRVRTLTQGQGSNVGSTVEVHRGEEYEYSLQFYCSDDAVVKDVILFDKLEQATDAANGEPGWRGVFESLDLTYIRWVGINPTVYYCTAATPEYFTMADIQAGSLPFGWTNIEPMDKSQITAIAVDLSEDQQGNSFVFSKNTNRGTKLLIRMRAPQDIPEVKSAYNRAAYYSQYSTVTAPNNWSYGISAETQETVVQIHQSGNLTISKMVSGNASSREKAFEFTIALSDASGQPLTDSYSYAGSSSGSITSGEKIMLKHGESITITGLPASTQYKVTEADYSAEGYTSTSVDSTGSIVNNQTAVAAFTNTKSNTGNPDPGPDPKPSRGNLTISKTVGGNASNTEKAFEFTVTLSNASGQPLTDSYSYTGSSSGFITSGGKITLKHGESITINGLPSDTQYEVTEADYSADGYKMSCTGNIGSILADTTATAAFYNKYLEYVEITEDDVPLSGIDLPKTGDSGTALWLWLMVLSSAALCLTLYMERKRRLDQSN